MKKKISLYKVYYFLKKDFIDAFPIIFVAAQLKFEPLLENKNQKISNGLNIIIFLLHMTSFITC